MELARVLSIDHVGWIDVVSVVPIRSMPFGSDRENQRIPWRGTVQLKLGVIFPLYFYRYFGLEDRTALIVVCGRYVTHQIPTLSPKRLTHVLPI